MKHVRDQHMTHHARICLCGLGIGWAKERQAREALMSEELGAMQVEGTVEECGAQCCRCQEAS